MILVNLVEVGLPEQIVEVFIRTSDDIGELEIFQNGGHHVDGFVGMGLPEIRIIIENGPPFFRVFEEFVNPFP